MAGKQEHDMNIKQAITTLAPFISTQQTWALVAGAKGEEKEYFKAKILEMAQTIAGMPKSYDTDGQGKEAVAVLHYFTGSWDWYITEKDVDNDGKGQIQAFGMVNGYECEMGYISIKEITRARAELDLHWTPCTLRQIKEKAAA
jgi:hypothetical protein